MKSKLVFFICFLGAFCAINVNAVTVYKDSNYRGKSQRLDPGKYNWADIKKNGAIGDDCISSLKVPSGYKVTLYHDPDFKTRPQSFTSNTSYVGNTLNDKTSSIIVEKLWNSSTPAAIYSGSGRTGQQQALSVGKYDKTKLDKLIGSTNIASARVNSNYRIVFYEDINKPTGRYTYNSLSINLPTALKGKVSYITVEPYNRGGSVTLYSEKDFKGVQQSFGLGAFSNPNQIIGSGKAKSLKVYGGYRAVLYNGPNGIRKSFTGNVKDIGPELSGKGTYLTVEKVEGGTPRMTLFKEKDYKGLQQSFAPGKITYSINKSYPAIDDLYSGKIMYTNTRSLKVEKGFKAKLFYSNYCTGTPDAVVSGDVPDARAKMKNKRAIYSIKLERDCSNNAVTVCGNAEFNGTVKELKEGEYPYNKIGLSNNSISSIFIPKGFVVILHDGNNFTGNSVAFNAANSEIRIDNLKDLFDNKTSSITIAKADSTTKK